MGLSGASTKFATTSCSRSSSRRLRIWSWAKAFSAPSSRRLEPLDLGVDPGEQRLHLLAQVAHAGLVRRAQVVQLALLGRLEGVQGPVAPHRVRDHVLDVHLRRFQGGQHGRRAHLAAEGLRRLPCSISAILSTP